METRELVTCVLVAIFIAVALALYLFKNSAIEQSYDSVREGRRRLFYNIATPILLVVVMLIIFVSLYAK